MADCRITCITLSGEKKHEHITHVGNSGNWKWTVPDVVQSIETKSNTFYVLDEKTNSRAEVGVVKPASGKPHLRTYADGKWQDNLLALPQCP